MKYFIVIVSLFILLVNGCKVNKESKETKTDLEKSQTINNKKTVGKVSYYYKSTGCSTVIFVFTNNEKKDTLILIPKDPLPTEFDIDKLDVAFNYRRLRMPQPKGCIAGFPVEISDLEKVK